MYVLDGLRRETWGLGYRSLPGPVPGNRLAGRVDRDSLDIRGEFVRGEVAPGPPLRLPSIRTCGVLLSGLHRPLASRCRYRVLSVGTSTFCSGFFQIVGLQVGILVIGVVRVTSTA